MRFIQSACWLVVFGVAVVGVSSAWAQHKPAFSTYQYVIMGETKTYTTQGARYTIIGVKKGTQVEAYFVTGPGKQPDNLPLESTAHYRYYAVKKGSLPKAVLAKVRVIGSSFFNITDPQVELIAQVTIAIEPKPETDVEQLKKVLSLIVPGYEGDATDGVIRVPDAMAKTLRVFEIAGQLSAREEIEFAEPDFMMISPRR